MKGGASANKPIFSDAASRARKSCYQVEMTEYKQQKTSLHEYKELFEGTGDLTPFQKRH
jgi:hypothetical protein